jgi:putative photosynthetic complex assembly protein
MNRMVQTRISGAFATPRDASKTLSRLAPAFVIAAIFALASAITVGEWRDGTLGVQRVVNVRSVVFEPRADGTLAVHVTRPDGTASRVDLPSSSEGFVATMAKSLARERRRFDVTPALPYQLSKSENGALMLKDPVLGTEVRLEAFGPTNVGAFAALM